MSFTFPSLDLGPTEPAGLQYLRLNGLSLDYDPKKWIIVPSTDSEEMEELLVSHSTVVWTVGKVLKRAFDFNSDRQEVIQALFGWFPCAESETNLGNRPDEAVAAPLGVNTRSHNRIHALSHAFKSTANVTHIIPEILDPTHAKNLERALVVILEELAYVYYLDGRRDVIHIPFRVRRAWSAPKGMVLERDVDSIERGTMKSTLSQRQVEAPRVPKIFFLLHPMDEIGLVSVSQRPRHTKSQELGIEDEIIFVGQSFLVTANRDQNGHGTLAIWHMEFLHGADLTTQSSNQTLQHAHRRRSSKRLSLASVAELNTKVSDLSALTLEPEIATGSRRESNRLDLSTNVDRMVFSDLDPTTIFADVEGLRKDISLNLIEKFPISMSTTSKLIGDDIDIFDLTADQDTVLCVMNKHDKLLTFHTFREDAMEKRRKRTSPQPYFVHSSQIPAMSATLVRKDEIEFAMVLDFHGTSYLCDTIGPKIVVKNRTCLEPTLCSFGEIALFRNASNSAISAIQLKLTTKSETVKLLLRAVQYIMSLQHFRVFMVLYLDIRGSQLAESGQALDSTQELDTFFISIMSCFITKPKSIDLPASVTNFRTHILFLVSEASRRSHTNRESLAVLKPYLGQLILSLHFVTEELKLSVLTAPATARIYPVLAQLTYWLGWDRYFEFYILHDPDREDLALDEPLIGVGFPIPTGDPPSLNTWLVDLASGKTRVSMQTIDLLHSTPSRQANNPYRKAGQSKRDSICPLTDAIVALYTSLYSSKQSFYDFISIIVELGLTPDRLGLLPQHIVLPIYDVLQHCSMHPLPSWSAKVLNFLGRKDLEQLLNLKTHASPALADRNVQDFQEKHDIAKISAMTEDVALAHESEKFQEAEHHTITRLLFSQDRRLEDVSRMLSYSKPAIVRYDAMDGLEDLELLNSQQSLSKACALRTMAIPVGRAFYTFNHRVPLPTESFQMPIMDFNIKIKPQLITVTMDKTIHSDESRIWGEFHNGVSAGLSVSRSSKEISASWIIYNKPEQLSHSHAGFLLGLGLNGHLNSMATWHAFNYLTSKHTMTSIGLLLGLSASFLGTEDPMITKLLSVHVLALLPPGSNELNLSNLTQSAGVLGIGLLYHDTSHRNMSEILFREISCQDNSSNKFRNEGYRLSAGFALGLINNGKGDTMSSKYDLAMIQELIACAQGKHRDYDDLDSKVPGSTVALALIYLKTNNVEIASRFTPPTTQYMMDYIRPDMLMVRALAHGLIMWSEVEPTVSYIASQLPTSLRAKIRFASQVHLDSDDEALYSIVTGTCLAVGFKYAGSGNVAARDLILVYLDKFIKLSSLNATNHDQKSCKSYTRTCANVAGLAAACVMAGFGDLEVLRRLRYMHFRLDRDISYGAHMASHMGIGLLFLGGGKYSLANHNLAICSYVMAFYPVFPNSTHDNRSHLQAARHIWTLGAEARCIVPRDSDSGSICQVPIKLTLKGDAGIEYKIAPCLLPPCDTISTLEMTSEEHMPILLDSSATHDIFRSFNNSQWLSVTSKTEENLTVMKSTTFENDYDSEVKSDVMAITSMLSKSLLKTSMRLLREQPSAQTSVSTRKVDLESTLMFVIHEQTPAIRLEYIKVILAYWDSTTTGRLDAKFAQCLDRLTTETMINKIKLDRWVFSVGQTDKKT